MDDWPLWRVPGGNISILKINKKHNLRHLCHIPRKAQIIGEAANSGPSSAPAEHTRTGTPPYLHLREGPHVPHLGSRSVETSGEAKEFTLELKGAKETRLPGKKPPEEPRELHRPFTPTKASTTTPDHVCSRRRLAKE
jgi:hypothetical protein